MLKNRLGLCLQGNFPWPLVMLLRRSVLQMPETADSSYTPPYGGIHRKGKKIMEKRARNNVFYLRLSDDEMRILNAKTKMSGLRDRSAFLRQLIVEGFVYDVDYSYLREYNAGLGKIGGNINQIAKRINETRSIYQADIDEIKKEMEKLWQLQKSMLSMQPYRKQ